MFIYWAVLSQRASPAIPKFLLQPLVSSPSTPVSLTFPYPPMLYSISLFSHFLSVSAPSPSTIHTLLPLSALLIYTLCPPSHPLPLPFSPSSLSLSFFAQDRSALITLMALMIQLNGALPPQCLSKAFLCSSLVHAAALASHRSLVSFSLGKSESMTPVFQTCDLMILLYCADMWCIQLATPGVNVLRNSEILAVGEFICVNMHS